ncbi:CatA-like O-acetyltransferase [Streptomyces sp. NPDC058847]|uniref:CatA-like O-acetyltransferase n=1 Tax=Streptomyces sp. NPDC058847 TaxID=3346649 RepID=UPI0036AB0AFD
MGGGWDHLAPISALGRYTERGGGVLVPPALRVHHAAADGFPCPRFWPGTGLSSRGTHRRHHATARWSVPRRGVSRTGSRTCQRWTVIVDGFFTPRSRVAWGWGWRRPAERRRPRPNRRETRVPPETEGARYGWRCCCTTGSPRSTRSARTRCCAGYPG